MSTAVEHLAARAPAQLPDGWRLVRLRDLVFEAQPGFACGERDPQGVIQLRMNNVDTCGRFVWEEVLRVPASPDVVERFRLQAGDVVFNNTNSAELVGKSALFGGYPEPVVYSNHFTRLRVNTDALVPGFLAAWLNLQWQRGIFAGICNRWIGQSAVKADKLLALRIPLPPLAEQRRIVAVLSEKLAAVEKARAAAEEHVEATRCLPAALLNREFLRLDDTDWPLARLGDVLRLRKEVVHPRDNPRGPARFVGLEHIESTTGIRTGNVDVEMSTLTGRKPRFYRGDIVYGYLRPYLNKVWIAEFDGLCSVDQYVYAVDLTRAETRFVAWFMRSPVYLRRSPVGRTPGWLPRIRTQEVASVRIKLPDLAEQRRIADRIDVTMEAARSATEGGQERIRVIRSLRVALLRRAFVGGL